jgi:hypothetical protein
VLLLVRPSGRNPCDQGDGGPPAAAAGPPAHRVLAHQRATWGAGRGQWPAGQLSGQGPSAPSAGLGAAGSRRSWTSPTTIATNSGKLLTHSARTKRVPTFSAIWAASTSRSWTTSMFSTTKPTGTTTTAGAPLAWTASPTSGPNHGCNGLPERLCQTSSHDFTPAASATSLAASRTCASYGLVRAATSGTLCAEKSTSARAPARPSAAARLLAHAATHPGWL